MDHSAKRSTPVRLLHLVLLALGIGVLTGWLSEKGPLAESPPEAGTAADLEFAREFETLFAGVAEKVKRAVVSVECTSGGDRAGSKDAIGSGFVIDRRGFVLTNHHLIESGGLIRVKLPDNSEFRARLVQSDPTTDVALLRIRSRVDLPALELGTSDRLRVGQWVLAVGSPFGLTQTVSAGIISALQRSDLHILHCEHFIQTDASINPGNSGGPLVDLRGEVIGINTATFSGAGGGNQGIGFAVPIDFARALVDRWIDGKTTGDLGVVVTRVDRDMARYFALGRPHGAFVSKVTRPLDGGNRLEPKDVVLIFNGQEVRDDGHLHVLVARTEPASRVELGVLRKHERMQFAVTLHEKEWRGDRAATPETRPPPRERLLGLTVAPLTENLANALDVADDLGGVVVMEVHAGSPASHKGIRQADVIVEVNDAPVSSIPSLRAALDRSEDIVMLRLVRDGVDLGYHFLPR